MIVKTEVLQYDIISPRQVFKHYKLSIPKINNKLIKPIVFIHGGAWRDPKNTYKDFDKLIEYMDDQLSGDSDSYSADDDLTVDFFSIDYRLSPEFKHPDHLIDVLKAIEKIQKDFKIDDISLVGHSVGSTLITQLLDYELILNSFNIEQQFHVPKISSIVFLEGIYDVKDMLDEYPSYSFFVDEAFETKEDSFYRCNLLGFETSEKFQKSKYCKMFEEYDHIIIVHSTNDELLSERQPKMFKNWLIETLEISGDNMQYVLSDFGIHNDVYENPKVARILIKGLSFVYQKMEYDV